jgi:hypothetical protein
VGWFALCVGAGMFAISVHGAIFLEAPPPSSSLTRSALVQGLVALFGTKGGYVAYHLTYAAGAAL